MVDYKKLLKAQLRGEMYGRDIPSVLCGDPDSEESFTDEEIKAYLDSVDEVFDAEIKSFPEGKHSTLKDLNYFKKMMSEAWDLTFQT